MSIHERDTGLIHPAPGPFLPGNEGPGKEGLPRLPALDLIRGVAILGILVANIPSFLGLIDYFGERPGNGSTGDRIVSALTLFFVDTLALR